MTKDDPVEHLSQELVNDDTEKQQQQQKPFQVVLVDIKEAARRNIICVEKPLEEDEKKLSFVALSYRWGELHEQIVNTHLGYLATITSFDLRDFYELCDMMTREPDLRSLQYVWVDAICVDQANYEKRKATIHQMSNIYEKATYILAVPDLHKQHLENAFKEYCNIKNNISEFCTDIYLLIQGDTEQLAKFENEFLDGIGVPYDRTFRKLLAKYTDYLAYGLTTCQNNYESSSVPSDNLDFLCKIYPASNVSIWQGDIDHIIVKLRKKMLMIKTTILWMEVCLIMTKWLPFWNEKMPTENHRRNEKVVASAIN